MEVKEILNSRINDYKFLEEILFICCVWNNIELTQFILNQNININFKLQVNNNIIIINIYFIF